MNNKVVYQIINKETEEILYIGSGNEDRPERSRKYSHITELEENKLRVRKSAYGLMLLPKP